MKSDDMLQIERIITESGAVFVGIQEGFLEDVPATVLFNTVPPTSTLALLVDGLTVEVVRERVRKAREMAEVPF